ncbi:hemagglutinin repeat-containing protein, partial [Acetobacter indonesiensis]|uniref:hemagglutinin repeat-containing protein n=4 Tax=Acetobacter indonesiensis TaxID=104101 RepID=UPI002232A202
VHATAAHLSGQDVDVHASRDITLDSGVNTDHTEATSSSKSASVGVEASVGMQGAGVSVTASASASHQHSQSDSMTHVDTVIQATDTVHLRTSGTTTLDGAEVNGERVDVKSGMLVISSPQDTASYHSDSESGGFSVSIPIYGAGSFGGSAHVAGQTIKDTYRSTESTQSGVYAGSGGLDVDVSGTTTLGAGALSSTADKSLNHFHTGSLDAGDVSNTSRWSGTSFAAGGGFTSGGSLTDAAKTITVAVGHVDHDEQSVTHSLITGTIDVETGSSTGAYSTDAVTANGHLDNSFNATKVNNTLQTQVGAETTVETTVEVGIQTKSLFDKMAKQGAIQALQDLQNPAPGAQEQSTSERIQAESDLIDKIIGTKTHQMILKKWAYGDDVLATMIVSETAKNEIISLRKKDWSMNYANNGTIVTDAQNKSINIGNIYQGDTTFTANQLSHELGHALHPTSQDLSSKDAFINSQLIGEGYATINNIKIRNEILSESGRDILVSGSSITAPLYKDVYNKYGGGNDQIMESIIAKIYGEKEIVGGTKTSYWNYYGDFYDKNFKK